jgi:transcriptional regulator with XRE-family HTH domain
MPSGRPQKGPIVSLLDKDQVRDDLRQGLADRLRGELLKKGWSAADLAQRIGLTRSAVARWVPGDPEDKRAALALPGAAEVVLICAILGVRADWLLGLPKK